jgi:hypothetical protein
MITSILFGLTTHATAQLKSHEIGPLWLTMFPVGSRPELVAQADLMTYPGGDFYAQSPRNMVNQGLWIGVMNWTSKEGVLKSFYVHEGGYLNWNAAGLVQEISNKKWVRQILPIVKVNSVLENRYLDNRSSSIPNPGLNVDEKITTQWATDVGVEITRNSYAFANPAFGHFIIQEFILKNTGNADASPALELEGQNLEDVYFGFWRSFVPSLIGHSVSGGVDDEWCHYYGNQPGDTLRGFWEVYDGDNDSNDYDDIGDPNELNGELLSPQHVGFGILHVDRAYDDETDDRQQPKTVNFWPRAQVHSHSKGDPDQTLYYDLSSGNQSRGSDFMNVSNSWDPQVKQPDILLSFGPYDIPTGRDIRIVLFDAVGSIDRKLAVDYGRQWINGQLTDNAKDALLATGRDSLYQHVRRAEWVWKNGFDAVPRGPESPNLNINAGPGKVELEWYYGWGDPIPTAPDFSGYRLYRAEESYANIYTKIWECGGNTGVPVANTYIDRNVKRGASYFYYVTAFDDGSQNTCELLEGQPSESSGFSNRNFQYAAIPSEGARSKMDSIYVVPNPYHVKGLEYGGTFVEDWLIEPDIGARIEDRLTFVGLPAKAKIHIFTASGNRVAVLDHPNPYNKRSVPGSADEAWFQITDSWQTPKSGVYFFIVEGWNMEGQSLGAATGKFVIIR